MKAFNGAGGVKVVRSPNALARVRSVHDVETVAQVALLAGRMEDPAFDASRTALFVGPEAPQLETCAGADKIELAACAPNRVRITAGMSCRGMIVRADTYFPGWQASVDGKPAPIWEIYGGLRGVVVDSVSGRLQRTADWR